MTKETVLQEKRRNGERTEEGRSIGRRAQRADSRDVRERKYKPLIDGQCGLYLRSRTSRQAALGGPIERQTFGPFVIFAFFVVKDG